MASVVSPGSWEEVNGEYLARGLAWIRDCLDPDGVQPADHWSDAVELNHAELTPALELLGDRFGLTRFERLVLLLVAATELDPGMSARCAVANGNPAAAYPTLALALSSLPGASWDVVSAQRSLRYWRLVELDEPRSSALTARPLRIDERILGFIKGLNELDDRLTHIVRLATEEFGTLPASHQQTMQAIAVALTEETDGGRPAVIELVGVDPAVRRGLAGAAARQLGYELYEMTPERIPAGALELGDLMRIWERETLLLPVLLYVDAAELARENTTIVESLLEGLQSPVLLGCREPWPLRSRRLRVIDVSRPTATEQEALWRDLLGASNDETAARLGAEFDLNQVVIADIVRQVQHSGAGSSGLWAACRAQARPRLDTLARRIEPAARWEDLVLPADELALLRHLVDQVRGRATVLRTWGLADRIKRGSAVTALFAGASGTGKTLAAEVIAAELELDLYRIDLAGVVSKYIGETERNLRRVFDAAEEGGGLLMFDEADALFGKRSEVKDSHDRYANIEVNYLLQRMEDYRGVAILATNQRHALDDAFLRRLRFIVPFPFPAPAERVRLWQRAFPAGAPVAELDIDRLARLAASGGMIRNIALNAAFCAAGRRSEVTMELVLEMARVEFRKVEQPVKDSDFRVTAV
ncbi:MAG: ATP-binding protein [Solirubrobacterales bacterium]|nr:ATP-binding protein [Solirubrobacterales bacterium]